MSKTASAQEAIEEYIEQLDFDGDQYFKSSDVAEATGASTRRVGRHLGRLVRGEWTIEGIEAEKWGYTNGTTWHLEKASSEP